LLLLCTVFVFAPSCGLLLCAVCLVAHSTAAVSICTLIILSWTINQLFQTYIMVMCLQYIETDLNKHGSKYIHAMKEDEPGSSLKTAFLLWYLLRTCNFMALSARFYNRKLSSGWNFVCNVFSDSLKCSWGFPQNTIAHIQAASTIFFRTPPTIKGVQYNRLKWHCILKDVTR